MTRTPARPTRPTFARMASSSSSRQAGVALFVALVMLVMLTLIVLTAVRMSAGNLAVVGNIQHRDEAITAANVAIEHMLSSDFTLAPAATAVNVDIDRDRAAEFNVQVATPVCLRSRVIPTAELNPANPADQGCFLGTGSAAGGLGGAAGARFFCAETLWDIRATAANARTGANVIVRQGISRRMIAAATANACD